MTINIAQYEAALANKINTLTSSNAPVDFLNAAKAVQFSGSGGITKYSGTGSFPAASTSTGQFALDTQANAMYYSDGSNWTPIAPPPLQNYISSSTTNGVTPAALNSAATTAAQAYALAAKQGYKLYVSGFNYSGLQFGAGPFATWANIYGFKTYNNNYDSWQDVAQSAVSPSDTLAVRTDGTLWGFGANDTYIIYPYNSNFSSMIQIGTDTNWAQVALGGSTQSAAAIKTDGTLWTWGNNGPGALGQGDAYNTYSTPTQVGSLTNWASIQFGYSFAIALKTDNTLWAWGNNGYGELGQGNTFQISSPQQIGNGTWQMIAANSYTETAAAIKSDGTLWAWGNGGQGQLGQGSASYVNTGPVQVGTGTYSYVSVGAASLYAIDSSGILWGCGYIWNPLTGNAMNVSTLTQLSASNNWVKVFPNSNLAGAFLLSKDRSLWYFGNNAGGTAGAEFNGTVSWITQVSGGLTWKKVCSNGTSAIGIAERIYNGV